MSRIEDDIANMTRHLYENLQWEKREYERQSRSLPTPGVTVTRPVRDFGTFRVSEQTSSVIPPGVLVQALEAGGYNDYSTQIPDSSVYELETVYDAEGMVVGTASHFNGLIRDDVPSFAPRPVMSEELYTYRQVMLPSGERTFQRVRYDPAQDPRPAVLMPRYAPEVKNGEFPGQGSVVVDTLMERTVAANARRALRDALEAQAEEERQLASIGRTPSSEPKPASPAPAKRYGRVLEP